MVARYEASLAALSPDFVEMSRLPGFFVFFGVVGVSVEATTYVFWPRGIKKKNLLHKLRRRGCEAMSIASPFGAK